MTLRERKAQRTRDVLHGVLLDLAEEHGYDAVTIEQVATAAEVGVSTLYRYFPNKDAILLDPLARSIDALAEALLARPADEPLDLALGHALSSYLARTAEQQSHARRLRAQIDQAAGPRARLWDIWNQQRTLLENAIAERTRADPMLLWVGVAAHTTMMVAQLTFDRERESGEAHTYTAIAAEILAALQSPAAVIPRLPNPVGPPLEGFEETSL